MPEEKIIVRPERLKTLKTKDAIFRSANDFQLTEQDFEQANLELGETEELRNASLEQLKKMLSGDKDMRYRTDDSYLLRYLRWRKFDCDRTYNTIRDFYSLRLKNPNIFTLPPNVEYLFNMGVIKCLPYRDETGSIICWADSKNWNLDEMSVDNLFQCSHAVSDVQSMSPSGQINSIICLWDLGGLTARHFAQCLDYQTVVTIMQCIQDTHPWRIKRVILFNCNTIVRTVYRLIFSKISKKMSERMKFLGSDVSELHQYINPAILPKCYGGNIEESECSITELIMDNMKYLEYEHSFIAKHVGQ